MFVIAVNRISQETLNLSISSIVWKRLVGEALSEDDLSAVDHNTMQYVALIRGAGPSDMLFEKVC